MKKYRNIRLPLLEVVAAGAISHPEFARGRLVPHIIVNSDKFVALGEAIEIHRTTPPGDVVSQWASLTSKPHMIVLTIDLKQPVELEFAILIDARAFTSTIDSIMDLKVMYLQAGKAGDKISSTLSSPSIVLEILGTSERWPSLVRKILRKQFLSERVNRNAIPQLVESTLKTWSRIRRRNELLESRSEAE